MLEPRGQGQEGQVPSTRTSNFHALEQLLSDASSLRQSYSAAPSSHCFIPRNTSSSMKRSGGISSTATWGDCQMNAGVRLQTPTTHPDFWCWCLSNWCLGNWCLNSRGRHLNIRRRHLNIRCRHLNIRCRHFHSRCRYLNIRRRRFFRADLYQTSNHWRDWGRCRGLWRRQLRGFDRCRNNWGVFYTHHRPAEDAVPLHHLALPLAVEQWVGDSAGAAHTPLTRCLCGVCICSDACQMLRMAMRVLNDICGALVFKHALLC